MFANWLNRIFRNSEGDGLHWAADWFRFYLEDRSLGWKRGCTANVGFIIWQCEIAVLSTRRGCTRLVNCTSMVNNIGHCNGTGNVGTRYVMLYLRRVGPLSLKYHFNTDELNFCKISIFGLNFDFSAKFRFLN